MDILKINLFNTGSKKSHLDNQFKTLINEEFDSLDLFEKEERFEIYNYVNDLINMNENSHVLNEIKYRATNGENLNRVILSVFKKHEVLCDYWFVIGRLKKFADKDKYNRFE